MTTQKLMVVAACIILVSLAFLTPSVIAQSDFAADTCPFQPGDGATDCSDQSPSDVDIITDDADTCPFQPGDGATDCLDSPPDSDGDIITGDEDTCPSQPAVDDTGCPDQPPDSDGDGVTDDEDACPSQGDQGYGVDATGCPLELTVLVVELDPLFVGNQFCMIVDAQGLLPEDYPAEVWEDAYLWEDQNKTFNVEWRDRHLYIWLWWIGENMAAEAFDEDGQAVVYTSDGAMIRIQHDLGTLDPLWGSEVCSVIGYTPPGP